MASIVNLVLGFTIVCLQGLRKIMPTRDPREIEAILRSEASGRISAYRCFWNLAGRIGLDYLDYEVDLSFPVPRNFGGVSGGGVWQVYAHWERSTGEVDWKMSLHGMAYWQSPIVAGRTIIRCHGAQTIQAAIRQLSQPLH